MYPSREVDLYQQHLKELFRGEAEPCLLGGWAVYLSVNERFRASTGRDYIGSRDIDVGFHITPEWSVTELQNSAFGFFLRRMKALGFQSQSYRLYRDFDYGSLKPLTPKEAESKPSFDVVKLYVDPVVDRIHSEALRTFNFTPIDEPLLEEAFRCDLFETRIIGELRVKVLAPHMLLATKLSSSMIRLEGHKRVKDIADIYALAWYSGLPFSEVQGVLSELISGDKVKAALGGVKRDEVSEAAQVLGVNPVEIRRVLRALRE